MKVIRLPRKEKKRFIALTARSEYHTTVYLISIGMLRSFKFCLIALMLISWGCTKTVKKQTPAESVESFINHSKIPDNGKRI